MTTLLQEPETSAYTRGESAPRFRAPGRRRWRSPGTLLGRATVGVALGATLLVGAGALSLPEWGGWFGSETRESSTTPLLLGIRELAEFHAGEGTFQVVVERERDTRYVPSLVSGESTTYLATGRVDALVDLSSLSASDIVLSEDGTRARITLAAPVLGPVEIDRAESRVLDRDRGALTRIGDALSEDPIDDREVIELGSSQIASAAAASDLLERAEENTRKTLTALAVGLGVSEVEIIFEAAAV